MPHLLGSLARTAILRRRSRSRQGRTALPGRAPRADDGAMTDTAHPTVTTIGELRLRVPVTVAPTAALDQAARIMRAHDISALLVGRPGEPASIVTERDITRA